MKKADQVLMEIVVWEAANPSARHYVYVLYKPDGTPFYVGKGTHFRLFAHEKEAHNFAVWPGKNTFKTNTICKIWAAGWDILYGIDSWHATGEAANQREVELIAKIGRQIKSEGPLTNLTAGGEGGLDAPTIREKLKAHFQNNPQAIKSLQDGKNKWIAEHPDEFAEKLNKQIALMSTPEMRQRVSATLQQFYKENPDVLAMMSEEGRRRFESNPELVEKMRQHCIDNKMWENLARWREEKPGEFAAHQAAHGDRMKAWYQENPEEAADLAARRNEKLRTDEHREKMSQRTKEFRAKNPEAAQERLEKANATWDRKLELQQECYRILQQHLIATGKLSQPRGAQKISSAHIGKWKKRGIIPLGVDLPRGWATISEWEEFKKSLQFISTKI